MSFRLRGGSKSRTTLSDVARLAGVSPITVSRALREPHKVSDKLREAILDVVEEIGYVPNFAARALASRHSGIVAVLAPILEMSGFFTPRAGRGSLSEQRCHDPVCQYWAERGGRGEASEAFRCPEPRWHHFGERC
nr:LacI family DNA-binding transcriptional regulator [Marinicella sp. W31]MDC2876032.1 LacI family DNA-binding transcriptional regulator [Marinicella sp. W31]